MTDELERRARAIAAQKMGLASGDRLPDDLWRQALPQAERELAHATLTAERDAALAEVQRLREAVTAIVRAYDSPQPSYDRAENGELSTRLSRAIEAARALVSPP